MAQADLPRGRDEWLWAAAGAMLLAAQVMLIVMTRGMTHANAATIAAVLPLILGLAIPTALLLLAGPRLIGCEPTPLIWAALFSAGLLMRAVWMGQTPPLEDDFLRYLWDGAAYLSPWLRSSSELTRTIYNASSRRPASASSAAGA